MSSKPLFKGLYWALTDEAKAKVDELVAAGMDFDLAFMTLDLAVMKGEIEEKDFYQIDEER